MQKAPALILCFLLLVGILAIIEPMPLAGATGDNWLNGWTYRKSHLISSATNADVNYQIRFLVLYGSGSDSGMNVYTGGKCLTTFDDIRWTSSDGSTLLDYWQENSTASSNATYWVEITGNLTDASQTVYLYYGNTSAVSSLSNFDNTFIFGEPFSSTTLDSAKWNSTGTLVYTINATAHYVQFTGGSTYTGSDGFHSKNNPNIPTSNWIMESAYGEKKGQYSYLTTSSIDQLGGSNLNFHTTWAWTSSAYGLLFMMNVDAWAGYKHVSWATGHNNTNDAASGELSADTISLYSLWWAQPNAYSQINASTTDPPVTIRGNSTISAAIVIVNIGVQKHASYPSATSRQGSFKIRRFVVPEPAYSTWGSEQGAPFYDLTKVGNTSNETVSVSEFYSFWYIITLDLSGYVFSWNSSGTYANDTWTAFSAANNSWANVSKTIDIAVGNKMSWLVYANSSTNTWAILPLQTYTVTATLSFYFNEGGTLGRNTTVLTNGTSTTYNTLTPYLDLEALANSTFAYLSINWTYGSTVSNSYVFAIVNATTIWAYFGPGYAQGWADGNASGYASGYSDGYGDGYTAGYSDGYFDGNATGWAAGNATGYTDGYAAGYAQGYADGLAAGGYTYAIARFDFLPSNPGNLTQILFNGSQSYSTTSISDFSWNFGDGNTTSGGSDNWILHIYGTDGSYNVTLTVTAAVTNMSAMTFHLLNVTSAMAAGGGLSRTMPEDLAAWVIGGFIGILILIAVIVIVRRRH